MTLEPFREHERTKAAFKQALDAYAPNDLNSEQKLYSAAKAYVGLNGERSPAASQAMARIAKGRWRRDRTDVSSLLEYLSYLNGFGGRLLWRDRIAGASCYRRVALVLVKLIPKPLTQACVDLMFASCQRAAMQYLIVEQPTRATPLAELSLRYSRLFVLWDKDKAHLQILPLKLASKVAFAVQDYPSVVEYQKEALRLQAGQFGQSAQSFASAQVQSERVEAAVYLEARSRLQSFTHWQDASDAERDALLAFGHRIPFARTIGEEYRLLGQAHAAIGNVSDALNAFDSSVDVLRSELASAGNRLLGLDVALEAIELSELSGDHSDSQRRARAALVEAEALKARGIDVPQIPILRKRLA